MNIKYVFSVPPKANTAQIAQPLNNIASVPVSVAHSAVLSRTPQSNNPAVSLPSDTGPMGSVQPPPLVVSEAQSTIQQTTQQSNLQISTHHHQQQIQQHMQQQVISNTIMAALDNIVLLSNWLIHRYNKLQPWADQWLPVPVWYLRMVL